MSLLREGILRSLGYVTTSNTEPMTKLRLRAVLENVSLAVDFVARLGEAAGFEGQELYQIQVAVDEACANIVQHAYAAMDPGDMEISCYLEGSSFVIQIQDWGQSFEPGDVADPDVDAPLEERNLGGLGLFLMRQFMDAVEFTDRRDGGNELTMVKRLPGAP
jgi:anti-sigma regulatory factor (Ser/Thr protein kinase)